MGGFTVNLQSAQENIDRTVQARFHGNANVGIDEELNEETLLGFFHAYDGNRQVRELVEILAGQRWRITAGFHRGGIGGAVGPADTRDHITLSTGHHVRFDRTRRRLIEITGHGITLGEARAAAAAAAAGPSAHEQELQSWLDLGLNQRQALKAIQKFPTAGMTRAALAQKIKSGK